MLERLARYAVRHRWIVIGAWVGLLVVLFGVSGSMGADYRTDFTLPDSESADVFDELEEADPTLGGFSSQIVYTTDAGVNDPAVVDAMNGLFAEVDSLDAVDLTSPYDEPGQISDDGTIAYAQLDIENLSFEEATSLGEDIREMGDEAVEVDGLTVEYGGDIFAEFEMPESEVFGILAAVVILILAFGSVLAMGLPIGVALFGLGAGTAIVSIVSHAMSMPDFTVQMVAMIGLGVGIDYALFIVTRYREAIHAGASVEDAVVESVDTSGRAVVFAGITVVISLLGLTLIGLNFVTGIAVGSAVGVLMMVLATLTLLPALLGWVGKRIDNTSRAALIAVALLWVGVFVGVAFGAAPITLAGLVLAIAFFAASFFVPSLRTHLPRRTERAQERRFWYRWSRFIQHRPWAGLLGAVVVLVVLAIPMLSMRLGFSDIGNLPETQTARRAYDLIAEGFGPGTNGQIFVTVDAELAQDEEAFAAFAAELDAAEGTARVLHFPVAQKDAQGNEGDIVLGLLTVYPDHAPQDAEAADLVQRLRNETIPASSAPDAKVGGSTAASADMASYLGERLPLLLGVVLLLSFVLLMAVFRSVLVPLKAVVMNLLSIGSAYGILVAVFQWGWLSDVIGVDRTGPIEPWLPMFLFAIVFGLSMDYEVFLLSRIKEEYDRSVRRGAPDNGTAVADGLAITARVITAAALIMFFVFGAFVLADDRQLKLFGLGLGIAVIIDATIVRMVLVPATMELLGDRNWWLPRWLDRILPKIDVEGHHRLEPTLDEELAALHDDEPDDALV
jgi:RND superfamily putative drug exporter